MTLEQSSSINIAMSDTLIILNELNEVIKDIKSVILPYMLHSHHSDAQGFSNDS